MANSGTIKWIGFIISIFLAFRVIECQNQNCSMIAVCNCTAEFNKTKDQQLAAEATTGESSTFILKGSADLCNQNSTISLTDLQVACTSLDPKTDTVPKLGPQQFRLTLNYPCAKPAPSESHGYSTGSVLVIIFFTLVFAYLLLGMTVNYFILGARGCEVIPNLAFWRSLPGLVKDGAVFVQNGFKPPERELNARSPESYDAI